MSDSQSTTLTERKIAKDLADYLREYPGACANGNVHGWAWIRFHDGEWQATRYYSGSDRLKSYVEGEVLDEDAVLDWLVSKPVEIIPTSEATLWGPSETTVWEDADEQDVFTDRDRCYWCGGSERTHDLTEYETVENGDCLLCSDCHESWENTDCIVHETEQHEVTA